MKFHPFQVSETHIVYACLGGFVVLFSMFSRVAKEKLYIGEVVFATVFGIVIGPSGLNIFRPRDWGSTSDVVTNEITLEVTRIVLALGVFAVGVELPKSYLATHWKSLVNMVIPVMLFGYVTSAGLLVALFPSLTYKSALVISACLTPTDPILAAAVVGGYYADKNVPLRIRLLLAAESAANDGLAYPFLFLPLYLILDNTVADAMQDFITVAILYEVVLGIIIGVILGWAFSKLMRFMERMGYIGSESYVMQFVALAILVEGIVTLLGNDDLLASFAAGSAVSWDGHFNEKAEDNAVFASLIEVMLNCVIFIFIGAWIQFPSMTNAVLEVSPGRLAAFFFSILFIRRIPPLLLLYKFVPDIRTWQEALFCGWFGPMGVGAVFVSTYALTLLPEPQSPPQGQKEILATLLHPIVAFTILGSILFHGLSIPAFSVFQRVRTMSISRTSTNLMPQAFSQPEWLTSVRNANIGTRDRDRDVSTTRSPTAAGTPTVVLSRRTSVVSNLQNLVGGGPGGIDVEAGFGGGSEVASPIEGPNAGGEGPSGAGEPEKRNVSFAFAEHRDRIQESPTATIAAPSPAHSRGGSRIFHVQNPNSNTVGGQAVGGDGGGKDESAAQ